MRTIMLSIAVAVAVGAVTGVVTVACIDPAGDCREIDTCCPDGTLNCFLTATGGHDGGTGGTGGGDSGPSQSCIPSENDAGVANTCGVFVSTKGSDTTGEGTQAAPYQTLAKAISEAGTMPVYACAGANPFNEALTVPAGATIYGGLDCTSWSYIGAMTKTTVTAGAGQVPVTLAMGSGAKLVDLHVLAADASTMNDGTSSIALVANGATAELDGCVIEAQGGRQGRAARATRARRWRE